MGIGQDDLFQSFPDALDRRSAALFVGAGLSIAAGYPDWRVLLGDVADHLGLDVKREQDLPAVAQFFLNRATQNRSQISQLLVDRFQRRPAAAPDNHRVLARLPVGHIWTQNYDELLELAWEQCGKRLDVKSRNNDLTTSFRDADAVLYKMHGTIRHADDTILTKDDYETYSTHRAGFLKVLESQLITNTFLFLGLSFTDPNLNYLLSAIRSSFMAAARTHYTILKRPSDSYDRNRFELFAADLLRYGISVYAVDEYADITKALVRIERSYAQRNVFVSGSFPEEGEARERDFIQSVSRGVGRVIAKRGLNLISGFGRTVGSGVLSGMIDELYKASAASLSRRMTIRPSRDVAPEGMNLKDFKRRYREDMISQTGIIVVVGGLRGGDIAPGVMDEFRIAAEQKKVILPVAATGHAARRIYEEILNNPKEYLPAELDLDDFQRLGAQTDSVDAIVSAVNHCLERIQRRK